MLLLHPPVRWGIVIIDVNNTNQFLDVEFGFFQLLFGEMELYDLI